MEIDFANQIYAFVLAVGATACICIFIFNKISCFDGRTKEEDEVGFDGGGAFCSSICCQSVLDSFCSMKEKEFIEEFDYAETVKSMDISISGTGDKHLPVEVNSAALATAQFLQAESNLNQLSAGDRARLAENRQVMKAYLISKLVAPRYGVDQSGKIIPETCLSDRHLDRFEFHERQSAMFHLVFNGQISVDTRATKRQQREAIRRLKRSNRERHSEKHEKGSSKVSISEKETSGVGTDLNSNPPITPSKDAKRTNLSDKKTTKTTKAEKVVKRSNSGSSESSDNSRNRPILQRIAQAIKIKNPDSAVGSSIGQYDADIESMDRGRRENVQNLQPVIEIHENDEKYRKCEKPKKYESSEISNEIIESEISEISETQRSHSFRIKSPKISEVQ